MVLKDNTCSTSHNMQGLTAIPPPTPSMNELWPTRICWRLVSVSPHLSRVWPPWGLLCSALHLLFEWKQISSPCFDPLDCVQTLFSVTCYPDRALSLSFLEEAQILRFPALGYKHNKHSLARPTQAHPWSRLFCH